MPGRARVPAVVVHRQDPSISKTKAHGVCLVRSVLALVARVCASMRSAAALSAVQQPQSVGCGIDMPFQHVRIASRGEGAL